MPTYALTPIWGNHILSTLFGLNFDGYATPSAGNDAGDIRRSIMKCDLSSVLSYETFLSATFTYTVQNGTGAYNPGTWSLYRIKQALAQTTSTWNSYSTGNAWQTPGATGANDIDSTALATGSVAATPAAGSKFSLTFDANGLIELKKMCNGTYTNNGFLIKTAEEATNGLLVYYNYNHATAGNRPELSIVTSAFAARVIWF